jgi:hypothetical protein
MPDENAHPQESHIPLGWEAIASFTEQQKGEAEAMRDQFRRNRQSSCITFTQERYIVWAEKFQSWPPENSQP